MSSTLGPPGGDAATSPHPDAMKLDDPDLDPLRDDAEFEALVEKVDAQLAAKGEG